MKVTRVSPPSPNPIAHRTVEKSRMLGSGLWALDEGPHPIHIDKCGHSGCGPLYSFHDV